MTDDPTQGGAERRSFLNHSFEFFKHLTTVNAAILVVLVVFVEKLFQSRSWEFLFPICVVFFLISLIACLVGMWFVTTLFAARAIVQWEIDAAAGTCLACIISFIIAMISFIFFAVRNFVWV
jgi:hypothetical protein